MAKATLNQELKEAIRTSSNAQLAMLIKQGADVNSISAPYKNHSPLALACYLKNVGIAKLLIKAGAKVNPSRKDGKDPLTEACDAYSASGDTVAALVKLLVENGAKPKQDKGKDGPLHYATMYGHLEASRLLLEHGAAVNSSGAYGRTPLIYASCCSKAAPDLVSLLLKAGAKVNAKNEAKENALFELITQKESANPEIAKLLLKAGIDLDAKNSYGDNALHWAAFCGRLEIVKLLVESGMDVGAITSSKNSVMSRAMSQNKTAVVKYLSEQGADVGGSETYNWSVLGYAAEKEDIDFVKKIIKQRNSGTSEGALLTAAKKGNVKLINLLLEAGIPADDRKSAGHDSPLMKAAYYGKTESVKCLLAVGADVSLRNYKGDTALLNAARNGHNAIINLLLDAGSDINEQNRYNWNALMQACLQRHYETAKLLLEKGSALDAIDKEHGATALSLAKHNNSKKLVQLLESYGAKERPIRWKKETEDWFSIFDCDICAYLADYKKLEQQNKLSQFKGLDTIFEKSTEEDRYSESTKRLLKCQNCATVYYNEHCIDDEDAFIGGPNISNDFKRVNLLKLKAVLKELNLEQELELINIRYLDLIESFKKIAVQSPKSIGDYQLRYVIESLTDYFIENQNWPDLEQYLLRNESTPIVFGTMRDIILMYGEKSYDWTYPRFTNYKSIDKTRQAAIKPFIEKHRNDLLAILDEYKNSEDQYLKSQYKSINDSAIYYKFREV